METSVCAQKPRAGQHPARGALLLDGPVKLRSFLANIPLFKELASDELERIAINTRQLRPQRAEVLFRRGDAALGFYIVVVGQVKLALFSPRGDEKVVDLIGPGQSFGEAVMFMECPHVITAQTLSDSLLLYVPREIVFQELEHDPRFVRRVIAGLSSRLHRLMSDLESDSLYSGTQRVIAYLLRDIKESRDPGRMVDVTLTASKGVIASRLSVTQEHFSRILRDLVARGLIEMRGRAIRIPDADRLRSWSD